MGGDMLAYVKGNYLIPSVRLVEYGFIDNYEYKNVNRKTKDR